MSPRASTAPADDDEDIEVLEVLFTEALAMIGDGRIADGTPIMLLQWAALQWAALHGPFTPAGHESFARPDGHSHLVGPVPTSVVTAPPAGTRGC